MELFGLSLGAAAMLANLSPAWIGRFSGAGDVPAPWRTVPYRGEKPTRYRIATVDGRVAIEAITDSSMSLMARPITIDLADRPILCWRWFIDRPIQKADMTRKTGDDYAARLYVGFDMPESELSAGTRFKLKMARTMLGNYLPDAAVVYVWDNRHPVGTAQKSTYTDRSQLIVAETGSGRAGKWVAERVDLGADFAKAFGGKGKPIHLAVASDGDNTKSKGRAAFADIHFVARGEPCAF